MNTIKNLFFNSTLLVAFILPTAVFASAEQLKSEHMFRNGEIILSQEVAKVDFKFEFRADNLPFTACTDLKEALNKSQMNLPVISAVEDNDFGRVTFNIHQSIAIPNYSSIALAKRRVLVHLTWTLSKRWPGLVANNDFSKVIKPLYPNKKIAPELLSELPILEPSPFKTYEFDGFEYIGPGMKWDGEHYHLPEDFRLSMDEDSVRVMYTMSLLDYCFGSNKAILLTTTKLDKFNYVFSSVHGTAFIAQWFSSPFFSTPMTGRSSVHPVVPGYMLD